MSDAAEVRALIAEARDIASGRWEPVHDDLKEVAARLADALEALVKEMHARELHHFETEKLLTEAGIDPDALEAAHAERSDPWCRDESCVHRHWQSGSMPTHRKGADCPAAHAEPDDEREALLRVLNQPEHAPMSDHDPRDGSCRSCPWPVYTLAPEDIAHAVLAAGFRRSARVPVSLDELAENLRRIHFDGTGCGTTASTSCSNCLARRP